MLSQGSSSSSNFSILPENSVRDEKKKICIIPENSLRDEKKKKSIIPKIFSSKKICKESSEEDASSSDGNDQDLDIKMTSRNKRNGFPERHSSLRIESLNLSNFDHSMAPATAVQDIRIFIATWNVGGKTPNQGLNLEDFLQVESSFDIYVLGFQEIVPLSAGNVLVTEDNEPAAKWLALISQALNKSYHESIYSSSESGSNSKHLKNSKDSKSNIFQKPSLKMLKKTLKADSSKLKYCNYKLNSPVPNGRPRKFSDPCVTSYEHQNPSITDILELTKFPSRNLLNYRLIASKQMVGLHLSIWARKELVQHIGHLKISCIGRGIMGCLGNKGCISISLIVHQTSFCFVCSHLASGEKEGDELRRNADVTEILKNTQFSHICKNPDCKPPERILDHDRIIWLGDLNYRVSLSYEEARLLLEDNNWDSLLEKDQLNLERAGGRVFSGFNEGKILFAPTYKYSRNSDSYAGETEKSKKKRRTPAWCDRILWRGKGIDQLIYLRGESRFSDHRPVSSVFTVEVDMKNKNPRFRKGFSCVAIKPGYEFMPQRHSFCEL